MQDVSQGEGRTVLFVSHNMASVRSLCKTGILLKNGLLEKQGEINDVVDYYLANQKTINDFERIGDGQVRFLDVKQMKDGIELGEDLEFEVTLQAMHDVETVNISLDIKNENSLQMAHVADYDDNFCLGKMNKGEKRIVKCICKNINFAPGNYTVSIWLGTPYYCYDFVRECARFYVTQGNSFIKRSTVYDPSAHVVINSKWSL